VLLFVLVVPHLRSPSKRVAPLLAPRLNTWTLNLGYAKRSVVMGLRWRLNAAIAMGHESCNSGVG